MKRFSLQSFDKGMKQRIQRGKLQGVLEAAGSVSWLQISSSTH